MILLEASSQAPAWLWPAFPILFVVMWVGVVQVIARMSGWSALAGTYASSDGPEGTTIRFGSGSLGSASYRGCLWFVSGVRGLHVSVLFFFRPGHPPLFIPWSDVSAQAMRGWVFEHVELRFARQPDVRLHVARSLAERLLAAGGNVVRIQDVA